MHRWKKKSLALLVAALFLLGAGAAPVLAQAKNPDEETNAGAMIVDFALIRPLGIAATAVGCVFFIVTVPFSAAGGNADQAAQSLVVAPAKHTFKRPLGHI